MAGGTVYGSSYSNEQMDAIYRFEDAHKVVKEQKKIKQEVLKEQEIKLQQREKEWKQSNKNKLDNLEKEFKESISKKIEEIRETRNKQKRKGKDLTEFYTKEEWTELLNKEFNDMWDKGIGRTAKKDKDNFRYNYRDNYRKDLITRCMEDIKLEGVIKDG